MFVTHGVILQKPLARQSKDAPEETLPIAHRETHGVSDANNGHHGISAYVFVGIDAVADGQLTSYRNGSSKHGHGNNQPKPMDLMSSSQSPDKKATGDEDQECAVEPQTVLWLHDTVVFSSFPQDEFITNRTRKIRPGFEVSIRQQR
jgi:hypothetical protein